MRKLFVIVATFFILGMPLFAQEVSPFFVGINGWMTEKIGGHFEPLMDTRLGPCTVADKSMNSKFVRIGGWNYSYDSNNGIATKEFLAGICKKVVDNGSIPLLQVPHNISDADMATWINYFKVQGLDIKHWLIGNEPDHNKLPYTDITPYTKRLSFIIRDNVPDAIIYAIGMSQVANMSNNLWLLDDLGGKDSKGRYIIDVVSFHDYASQNSGTINWGSVDNILSKVNTINNGRPSGSKLKWIIGEFNTSYSNNIVDQWHKTYSFNAGQIFIGIAKEAIKRGAWSVMPWSIEENGSSRGDADLGMFDAKNGVTTPRSTAVHWTMLGRTLRSTYLPINAPNGITIASKDQYGYSLLIANNTASNSSFSLSFNGTMSFTTGSTYSVASYTTKVFTFDLTGSLKGEANYTPTMSDNKTEPTTYPMATGCEDNVLSKISISAPKTTVKLDESVTLTVIGESSCKSLAVPNLVWSANALGGVFKNSTEGVYRVTATSGSFKSDILITVTNDAPVVTSFKVEAESYTSFSTQVKDQFDKNLQKENDGLSIGYFNQAGETVTYTINVPIAGEYDVVLKYCSDGAGTIGFKAGSSAEQTVSYGASSGSPWYLLPFAEWPTSAATKVTLAAGTQTMVITNKGNSINLDYLEFTNSSASKDVVAPVITLIGDQVVTIVKGSTYSDAGASAKDSETGNLNDLMVTVNPVNVNVVASYTVTYNVTDMAGNKATQVTRTVHVIIGTSLSENSDDDQIKVYPNPSNGLITINALGNYNVDVYTVSGAKVLSFSITEKDNLIDLTALKGLYLLRIYNNTEEYHQKVLVK